MSLKQGSGMNNTCPLKQLMRFWYLLHMHKSLFQTHALAYQAGLEVEDMV